MNRGICHLEPGICQSYLCLVIIKGCLMRDNPLGWRGRLLPLPMVRSSCYFPIREIATAASQILQ